MNPLEFATLTFSGSCTPREIPSSGFTSNSSSRLQILFMRCEFSLSEGKDLFRGEVQVLLAAVGAGVAGVSHPGLLA